MGMFDTIHVRTPLICPVCAAEIRSLQTKEFDSTMANFRIGSVLSGSAVLTGIIKEHLWCKACSDAGQPSESPIYLVVWHSLLAGIEQDLAKAESRLAAVDRLDLIGWLDEAQREAARWRHNFHTLHHDVSRWHQHLTRPPTPLAEMRQECVIGLARDKFAWNIQCSHLARDSRVRETDHADQPSVSGR